MRKCLVTPINEEVPFVLMNVEDVPFTSGDTVPNHPQVLFAL